MLQSHICTPEPKGIPRPSTHTGIGILRISQTLCTSSSLISGESATLFLSSSMTKLLILPDFFSGFCPVEKKMQPCPERRLLGVQLLMVSAAAFKIKGQTKVVFSDFQKKTSLELKTVRRDN